MCTEFRPTLPLLPARAILNRTSPFVNLRLACAVARTAYVGFGRLGNGTLSEIQRGRANLPVSRTGTAQGWVSGSAGLFMSGVAARPRKTYDGDVSDLQGKAGGQTDSDNPALRTMEGRRMYTDG